MLASRPYELTAYPWEKAQGQIGRQAFSPIYRYGQWSAIVVTSLWLGLSIAQVNEVMIFGRATPLIVGVVGFSILIIISRIWKTAYANVVNASAFRAGKWRMAVADDGLHLDSELVHQVFGWQTMTDVRDGPNGFLIMVGPVFFLPVPKEAFANDGDMAAFRQAVAAQIAKGAK
jgi:YcxB-like protein